MIGLLVILALILAITFLPKAIAEIRKNQVMTVTKYRGPFKQRYRKLKVDIGRKVNYKIPYEETDNG